MCGKNLPSWFLSGSPESSSQRIKITGYIKLAYLGMNPTAPGVLSILTATKHIHVILVKTICKALFGIRLFRKLSFLYKCKVAKVWESQKLKTKVWYVYV